MPTKLLLARQSTTIGNKDLKMCLLTQWVVSSLTESMKVSSNYICCWDWRRIFSSFGVLNPMSGTNSNLPFPLIIHAPSSESFRICSLSPPLIICHPDVINRCNKFELKILVGKISSRRFLIKLKGLILFVAHLFLTDFWAKYFLYH